MQANHHTFGAKASVGIVLGAMVASLAGCTSPLTTVALREFLRESTMTLAVDSDAEDSAEAAKQDDDGEAEPSRSGHREPEGGLADADEADPEDVPVDERIARSLDRLARTSGFDPVARDVLVDTLEKASPEDWPAIIDSFTMSLESSPSRSSATRSGTPPAGEADPRQPSKRAGGLTIPVAATLPINQLPDTTAPEATSEAVGASEPTVVPAVHENAAHAEPVAAEAREEPQPVDPAELVDMLKSRLAEARRNAPLVVRRACFASKVRGWGNLDAFEEPRFVPGQDVLVYVELDNLDGIDGPRGFATGVEGSLRLLDDAGDVVERWGFPTVEDRSDSPRTDYFVRYLVRIPRDAAAGGHRLEITLTDTVSSKTVTATLPLEVEGG